MQRSRELDAAVAVLGVSWLVMFFGGAYGWWVDWWHSTSDFRLPMLLLAVGSSTLAGMVAAATYDWIRARAERRRWRRPEHVGAVQLMGYAVTVADNVASIIRESGSDAPTRVGTLDEIEAVVKAFRGRHLSNFRIAEALGQFSQQAWEVVSSMPGLRDDAALMELTSQAVRVVPNWARLLKSIESVGVSDTRVVSTNYAIVKCAKVAWQLVRKSYELGSQHIDPDIEKRADAQLQEDLDRIQTLLDRDGTG